MSSTPAEQQSKDNHPVEKQVLKKGKRTQKWFPCVLTLDEKSVSYRKIGKDKRKQIPLQGISIRQPEEEGKQDIFILVDNSNKREHYFKVADAGTCTQWMEEIFSAKLDESKKDNTNSESCVIQ